MNKNLLVSLGLLCLLGLVELLGGSRRDKLIDPEAIKEPKALYRNVRKLSKKHILFGH